MVVLGKAKKNNEKFYNLYFICLGINDYRISCRLDRFPTECLINADAFFTGIKDEKI